jgi:hypothetical protein
MAAVLVATHTLLTKSHDNVRTELEYVKALFPPELHAEIPEISTLTVDNWHIWMGEWKTDKTCISDDLMCWIMLRYGTHEAMRAWKQRLDLLIVVLRRVYGSVFRGIRAVCVSSVEELLLKYYSWRLDAVIPPHTNRWKKMKMFLEERRDRFTSE